MKIFCWSKEHFISHLVSLGVLHSGSGWLNPKKPAEKHLVLKVLKNYIYFFVEKCKNQFKTELFQCPTVTENKYFWPLMQYSGSLYKHTQCFVFLCEHLYTADGTSNLTPLSAGVSGREQPSTKQRGGSTCYTVGQMWESSKAGHLCLEFNVVLMSKKKKFGAWGLAEIWRGYESALQRISCSTFVKCFLKTSATETKTIMSSTKGWSKKVGF